MQDSLAKIPNIFRSSGVARYVHMQDIGLEHAGRNKSEGRMDSETACVAHEVFEQGKFLGGKVNGASSSRNPSFDPVQFKILDLEHRFGGQTVSSQQGPNSGRQFRKGERLNQRVVCANVEA